MQKRVWETPLKLVTYERRWRWFKPYWVVAKVSIFKDEQERQFFEIYEDFRSFYP